jgi:hypothetical protein
LNKTLQTATESAAGVEGMIQTALAAIKASAERAAALSQRQREQQERRQQRMSNQNQPQTGLAGGRPFGFMMPAQQFMNQQPMMMMMQPQFPQQPMYGYPNQMQNRRPMNQRSTPAIMQPGNQSTKFAANPSTPEAEEAPVVEPTWIYVQNVPQHDAIEASLRAHFEVLLVNGFVTEIYTFSIFFLHFSVYRISVQSLMYNFTTIIRPLWPLPMPTMLPRFVCAHSTISTHFIASHVCFASVQALANGSVFDEHQLQLSLASESVMESLSQTEAADGQAEEQPNEYQTEEYDPETEIYDDGNVNQDATEEVAL